MITTLPAPCWLIDDPSGQLDANGHYPDEQSAKTALADLKESIDDDPRFTLGLALRQQDAPCVTATCNDCGEVVGSEEFTTLHFDGASDAAYFAEEADFAVIGSDVWCGDCRAVQHVLVPSPTDPEGCLRCDWDAEDHLSPADAGAR